MHICHFKNRRFQKKFQIHILLTISLKSVTYCTQCLIKKCIKLCQSCCFNPEKYAYQYYDFLISLNNQIYGSGLLFFMKSRNFWKKPFKSEGMRTAHFTFAQPNVDTIATALTRCLRKGIFDWSFKMQIIDFFSFSIKP